MEDWAVTGGAINARRRGRRRDTTADMPAGIVIVTLGEVMMRGGGISSGVLMRPGGNTWLAVRGLTYGGKRSAPRTGNEALGSRDAIYLPTARCTIGIDKVPY